MRLFPYVCVASIFLLATCAEVDLSVPDGGSGDGASLVSCKAGGTRCVDKSYQICSAGYFTEALKCDATRVCVPKLGCVDCNPAQGTFCVEDDVHECNAQGRAGKKIKSCLGQTCFAGECVDPGCSGASRLIYVVDEQNRLLSFNPAAENNHFKLIAKLQCPTAGLSTPFSMSVDRSARGWVLYTNGEIYWVDTKTGACTASPFQKGQLSFSAFGMGFVSDEPNSSKEKLFIAGGEFISGTGGKRDLGYIEPATMKITEVGPIPQREQSPELTGTGKAELFAYYPGATTSSVVQLEKKTGKLLKEWKVTPLGSKVTAWAFAHWGGKFYIFPTALEGIITQRSRVLLLDPDNGKTSVFLGEIPYKIVGAGVSTCAPVIE